MTTLTLPQGREFQSGDIVDPGTYVDIETGATVEVREADSLPEGRRVVTYARRFQRVDPRDADSVTRPGVRPSLRIVSHRS